MQQWRLSDGTLRETEKISCKPTPVPVLSIETPMKSFRRFIAKATPGIVPELFSACVEGSISPLTMNCKNSDLIGAFFMPDGFVLPRYSLIPVLTYQQHPL